MGKKFISAKDESVRMFESDFMEFFSKVHWTVPLYIYIPFIIFLLYMAMTKYSLGIPEIIALFAAGAFLWTLAEYALHRFVFHFEPKSELGRKLHWTFHGVHHDYPQDSRRLVMPPSISIPLAVIFYFFFSFFMGTYYAPFFAGFVAGYLAYDMTHYAVHHFAIQNKFWLKIKTHHMKHHYLTPDHGFGVTVQFWDKVFGTEYVDNKTNNA